MKPVQFPESNTVLTPPDDMTEEECSNLDIFRTGDGCCISCWELDGDELMQILETKRIWLRVHSGESQPPVSLATESPFVQEEGTPA